MIHRWLAGEPVVAGLPAPPTARNGIRMDLASPKGT
jgi:hypothetical protein